MEFSKTCILWGFALLGIALLVAQTGSLMNEFAMESNGGKMPVLCLWKTMRQAMETDPIRIVMTAQCKMKVLCDIIPDPHIKPGKIKATVLSPGDIFIKLGLGMAVLGGCIINLPIVMQLLAAV